MPHYSFGQSKPPHFNQLKVVMCDVGNLVVVNYLRGCGIKFTILLQIILKMLLLCYVKITS